MLRFGCSPDVSLQDLGSGCISGALKTLKDKETHVGFSGRVIFTFFRDAAVVIPHILFPGAEGEQGELFEARARRDSALVIHHMSGSQNPW